MKKCKKNDTNCKTKKLVYKILNKNTKDKQSEINNSNSEFEKYALNSSLPKKFPKITQFSAS